MRAILFIITTLLSKTNPGKTHRFIFRALALIVLFRNGATAQTPIVLWARMNHGVGNIGTNWSDNFGTGIVSDSKGNVYTTGRYVNKVDFDPGPGYDTTGSASPPPDNSCFLVKYDSAGNWVWRRTIHKAQGNDIALDDSGNVYHCGKIDGTAVFGTGASAVALRSTDSSLTGGDMFVAKWNSQGVFQWARAAGGDGTDLANKLAVDHNGNVYVGGKYFSSAAVDFDRARPGAMALPATRFWDGFLIKYDLNGTPQWVRQIDGGDGDGVDYVAISPASGNIVISGYTSGCKFPPNTTFYTSHGNTDAMLAIYTPSGTFVRAKIIGGADNDMSGGLAIDKNGDIYFGGYSYGTLQFDPLVPSSLTVRCPKGAAGFIVKMSDTGAYKWSKSYGSAAPSGIRCLVLDDTANVYVMGIFQDSVNLNPVTGRSAFYTSSSIQDMFLLKLNTGGGYVWSVPAFSNHYTDPWSISLDYKANLYAIGAFADTCNFDPGVSGAGLRTIYWQAGMSGQNTFAVKYSHLTHTKSTGISTNFQFAEHISVFPNPAAGLLTLRGLQLHHKYRLSIADMLGRRQISLALTGEPEISLSLNALPTGNYVLSCLNLETGAAQQVILTKTGE